MTSATIPAELLGRQLSLWQRILLYLTLAVLLALALWVSTEHPYSPGSRVGYDLGLVGGCMMLVLLLYPLRKRWSRLHNFGSLRAWFAVHLVFGICGPLLVLFHSGFRLHSFNASVAFWCMVLVALSGGMGRYIYLHVYRDLSLNQARLWELEGTMESHGELHPFDLVPHAREWLEEYRRHPFARRSSWFEKLRRVFARADRGRRRAAGARRLVASALERHARRERWSALKLAGEKQAIDGLIVDYVRVVDTTVRLTFWERVFAWWHIAHGPVVYILVISAVAHVVAVHVY
ncbi:MAG TPA: hypothetical protein VKA16_10860 [Burkholderiales bacterium]|nr:hypothetical protein [Burkholderiales bacterium]